MRKPRKPKQQTAEQYSEALRKQRTKEIQNVIKALADTSPDSVAWFSLHVHYDDGMCIFGHASRKG